MKIIELTRGWVCWVSDRDYPRLNKHNWNVMIHENWAYAVRHKPGTPGGVLYMHREIVGGEAATIDHVRHRFDEKVIDNRRSNLRPATHSQNIANSVSRGGRSIFKGVAVGPTRADGTSPWRAYITTRGKQSHLGYFRDEGHAALARDIAAVKLHGSRALTNFPVPGSRCWMFGELP